MLWAQFDAGWNGFLSTRASWMLDLVVVAMVVVLPLLGLSIALVRYAHRYVWHRGLQLLLGLLLLAVVVAFEVDMRFFTDWQARAEPSPYFSRDTWSVVRIALVVHLMCAVPTLVLWVWVIVDALRHFPRPPTPGPHSRRHVRWARLAAVGMVLTAVTGWTFYYLGFVAS